MTVRERVLLSRLIEKIENNHEYARQLGLSYKMTKSESKEKTAVKINVSDMKEN